MRRPKIIFLGGTKKEIHPLGKKLLEKGIELLHAPRVTEAAQLMGIHNIDLIVSELPAPQSDVFIFCKANFDICPNIFFTTGKNNKYDSTTSSIGDLIIAKNELEKKLSRVIFQVLEQRRIERLSAA